MNVKGAKVFLLVLAWLMASSHCIAADLLDSYFSPNTKVADDCCGHRDSNRHTPGQDHHSSCKDKGCCQPLLKTFELKKGDLAAENISLTGLPISNFILTFFSVIELRGMQLPFAQAPPRRPQKLQFFLLSAPNAPPTFS